MKPTLIDHGKLPDEPYNAALGFWLPPDTPFGNFQLKLMKLCQRVDEANRRILDSFESWRLARSADGLGSPTAWARHVHANEQVVHLLRRAADELIAMVWYLTDWEAKGSYADRIDMDRIGKCLNSPKGIPVPFTAHEELLRQLNDMANAFKHSFVNSDISLIGRDEPCVHALGLKYNKLTADVTFHNVSLAWLTTAFTEFYRDGLDWLRAFSDRRRQ